MLRSDALTIILLTISNIFMTFAWYGHLRFKSSPLWIVILASWGIAFVVYCFQVPANRIGAWASFRRLSSKVIQESDHARRLRGLLCGLPAREPALEPRHRVPVRPGGGLLHVPEVRGETRRLGPAPPVTGGCPHPADAGSHPDHAPKLHGSGRAHLISDRGTFRRVAAWHPNSRPAGPSK